MPTVKSNDGTTIAYDKQGEGPALIVVDGALNTRMSGTKPQLIGMLSPQLTVYTYDRRGRGDSGADACVRPCRHPGNDASVPVQRAARVPFPRL
jgi:hypothetical protein